MDFEKVERQRLCWSDMADNLFAHGLLSAESYRYIKRCRKWYWRAWYWLRLGKTGARVRAAWRAGWGD